MLDLVLPKNKLGKHIFILWFILAVIALAASGLYSFLPYSLRTPFIAQFIDLKHLFNVSLMVHVNLGVLVWFLSCSAMLMVAVTKESFLATSFVAFIAAMIGTVFIIASPFVGAGQAIKNDYIPMLHNLAFILGLSLFVTGILLQVILTLLSYRLIKGNLLKIAIYFNALIFLLAVLCFIKTCVELKAIYQTRFFDFLEYYQLLFWGTGHVLQFCYIQLIIIGWLIISKQLLPDFSLNKKLFISLQAINFLVIIPCLIIYWIYPLDSFELYDFFTIHMKHSGGLLVIIMALWIGYKLCKNKAINLQKFESIFLLMSLFLIISGGVIGYLITGANVTVPAHYHGVILGITSGMMGMFFVLLPKLGFRKLNNKAAIWQIMLYGIGQFIHILALAISGGYGVLRKDPGTELSAKAKFFMGAMGIGGSLALIGGILFVVLIFKNMRKVHELKAK
jgi:cytochrome c oxidase subunit 1